MQSEARHHCEQVHLQRSNGVRSKMKILRGFHAKEQTLWQLPQCVFLFQNLL
jgi:hypothetical protein